MNQIYPVNTFNVVPLVEYLQIGRLDDCIQHYTILQNNLIQPATELDNYPTEEADAYDFLNVFPDEIMRKGVLENYLTTEEKASFQSPFIPPCEQCFQNKVFSHIQFSAFYHSDLLYYLV